MAMKSVFSMETGDPDDVLALVFLLGHPRIMLEGVLVTKGSPEQIGLVRHVLGMFGRGDLPVGAFDIETTSRPNLAWYRNVYGDFSPSRDAETGPTLLAGICGPETTLISGAPMENIAAALNDPAFTCGKLLAQGGFCGANLVPPERQLEKFRGRIACPSWNLDGNRGAAKAVMRTKKLGPQYYVAKNVCHGVEHNSEIQARLEEVRHKSPTLGHLCEVLGIELKRGKRRRLHDVLCAACAIDGSIGQWEEVRLRRVKEGWMAEACPGSRTKILVAVDEERFLGVLTAA